MVDKYGHKVMTRLSVFTALFSVYCTILACLLQFWYVGFQFSVIFTKGAHPATWARSEQIRTDQNRSEQIRTDQNRSEQIRTDQNRSEQIRTDQNRSEKIRTDRNRSEQIRTDQNRSEEIRTDQEFICPRWCNRDRWYVCIECLQPYSRGVLITSTVYYYYRHHSYNILCRYSGTYPGMSTASDFGTRLSYPRVYIPEYQVSQPQARLAQ